MPKENVIKKEKVILNLIQDLQRLSCSLRNGWRGRFQIKFGMTPLLNNGGFTLIELLVVVLIIGILAAIALPQYQLAVEKARASEALIILKSVSEAAEIYYLEHGTYPTSSITQMDIKTDRALQYFSYRFFDQVYLGLTRKGNSYTISHTYKQNETHFGQGRYSCNINLSESTDSIAAQVCKSLCGTSTLKKIWGSGELGCIIGYY